MENYDANAFGESVRAYRNSIGMSRAQLAELAQVSSGMIYRLETGRCSVRLESALKVVNALGTTIDSLILRTEAKRGAASNQSLRERPAEAVARATSLFRDMSGEHVRKILKESGMLGDDEKLTKYSGGESKLSKEFRKLPS